MVIEAKVVRLKNISSKDESTMYVQTGDVFTGFIIRWPEVGESFCLYNNKGNNYELRTAPVTKKINDKEFETLNSIYRITTKADIRDEKINNILENEKVV